MPDLTHLIRVIKDRRRKVRLKRFRACLLASMCVALNSDHGEWENEFSIRIF